MQVMAQQEPRRNSGEADPDPGIIAEWILSRHERVRVSIERYKGAWLINVRKWFAAESGELRPSRHGIALGVKNLPRLAAALTEAAAAARRRELIAADQEDAQ
jgi:hypothetical protein